MRNLQRVKETQTITMNESIESRRSYHLQSSNVKSAQRARRSIEPLVGTTSLVRADTQKPRGAPLKLKNLQ